MSQYHHLLSRFFTRNIRYMSCSCAIEQLSPLNKFSQIYTTTRRSRHYSHPFDHCWWFLRGSLGKRTRYETPSALSLPNFHKLGASQSSTSMGCKLNKKKLHTFILMSSAGNPFCRAKGVFWLHTHTQAWVFAREYSVPLRWRSSQRGKSTLGPCNGHSISRVPPNYFTSCK